MRKVVLAVIGLVLSVGIAGATVPDPDNCSVEPCDTINGVVVSPYSGTAPASVVFTANIRNSNNDPIPNAFVELIFGTPGNHFFCGSAVLTGTTDANGDVTFAVAAGGCTMGANAMKIRANQVEVRNYPNVKSPDYNGVAGDGMVVLADFTTFGNAYVTGAPGCTDYYNDGVTGLPEFTTFGGCWAKACP
jgi:hypothetical protein